MDQVKVVLAALKKYHFWVLCGLVVLMGLAGWWLATSALAKQFDTRSTELQGHFAKLLDIVGRQNHPNEKVIAKIEDTTNDLKKDVYEAWEILYEEQDRHNPLPNVLTDGFKDVFRGLDPEDDIPREYREEYQSFIQYHIPRLFGEEGVNVLRPKEIESEGGERAGRPLRLGEMERGGFGERAGGDIEMVGVVDWAENDRQRLIDRFNWQRVPSTLRVRLAQEDLWVYEALVRIIRNTNEGADANYNAVVKQIEALQIGAEAVAAWRTAEGRVFSGSGNGGEGGMGGMGGSMAGEFSGNMTGEGEMMGGAGGAEGGERQELLAGRYVNKEGNPLGAEEKHPFAEFKLMPIRMVVVMDQRKIDRLLTECANSTMPIEVTRVSLWPSAGKSLNLDALATAASPGGHKMHHSPGMGKEGMMGYGEMGGNRGVAEAVALSNNDIPIEIHGIISIFNKPDKEKLGTGAASEKPEEQPTQVEPGATPTVPTQTPPAATPAPPAGESPAAPAAAQPPAAVPGSQPPAAKVPAAEATSPAAVQPGSEPAAEPAPASGE